MLFEILKPMTQIKCKHFVSIPTSKIPLYLDAQKGDTHFYINQPLEKKNGHYYMLSSEMVISHYSLKLH